MPIDAPSADRTSRPHAGRGNARILLVIALWAVAVIGGEVVMWSYQLTPGAAPAAAPATWPADAAIPTHAGRPLLLMVAHPKCACTRASLNELRRLVARFEALPRQPELYLSLIVPEGAGADWVDGPVLRNAASISSLHVALDPGGRFARQLGATTSGHVLVYGGDGALLFSGGITAARAHEGDAAGQDAIVAALYGKTSPIHRSPVFGCGLRSPAVKGETL
ncbi:MAG TPA: RedB protein [Thermoanaerobaculia bacterium]|nr:RedB protein [Thermoanaerobaculia bacterium]